MTKRELTPAQTAALDHDENGEAGGAHAPVETPPVSENPDSPAAETEIAADAEQTQPETETVADADGADAAAADEGADRPEPSGTGNPERTDDAEAVARGAGAEPPHDATRSRDGVADEPPAPAIEDEDQAAAAPIVEDENQSPTAVNLEKAIPALRDMAANRYGLYRRLNGGGYTSDPAGGGLIHDSEVVDGLIDARLAVVEPSGGLGGSVKITPAGREQLALASAA